MALQQNARTHQVQGYESWTLPDGPVLRVWQHAGSRQETHTLLPHSETSLAVSLGASGPRLHVFGPDAISRTFVSQRGDDLVAIAMAPETLTQLTGLSAREWQGVCAPAPPALLQLFEPAMDHLMTVPEPHRPRLWLKACREQLSDAPIVDAASWACQRLRARCGSITISRLACETGLSTRQLQRAIRDRLGVGPKAYARQLRLTRAMMIADCVTQPRWSLLALEAGYADQAHLIRECQALTGTSPARLHQRRHGVSETSNTRVPSL